MSRRRANKRKGNEEAIAVDDGDDEERKEDKRSRLAMELVAAAAVSSSPAAAAPAPSSSSAAVSSASGAAPSSVGSSAHAAASIEELLCCVCLEPFECADGAARLPRLLPCGRHQLCSSCIVASIKVNPGSVRCPKGHGLLPISTAGVAAAALSSADDWMRLLPPFADFIAAIRNQQLMMTRIAQKGVECTHQGCKAAVTHFCADCGELCSTHEGKRHSIEPFTSHKQKTIPIAQKTSTFQSKIAGPAAQFRAQANARMLQQQQPMQIALSKLKQLEEQLQQARQEVQAKEKVFSALKQTADLMSAANDSAVVEMEADRLEANRQANRQANVLACRALGSTVLNTLSDECIVDLQTFLGPAQPLSKATLLYRATRDGFTSHDWRRLCGGKLSLLTIVRVKGNGFVFGAFSPFQWPAGVPAVYAEIAIADPTGETFLFSLVNAANRAVKLRLKDGFTAGVVSTCCGPLFGLHDLCVMSGGNSADSQSGNWAQPNSFQFDCATDGGAPIAYDKSLLAGDDGKGKGNLVYFAAAEIECWQL